MKLLHLLLVSLCAIISASEIVVDLLKSASQNLQEHPKNRDSSIVLRREKRQDGQIFNDTSVSKVGPDAFAVQILTEPGPISTTIESTTKFEPTIMTAAGTSVLGAVESAAETTTPAAKTTIPAAETTTPASETTIPAAQTTTRAAQTTTPAAGTTIPAAETTIQAAGTTISDAETTIPAAETTTPAAETTIPATETTTPAAETSTPAAETTTPAAETTIPAAETTIQDAETMTPAADTTTPAAGTAISAAETTIPAAETTTLAAETSTPAAETTTPAAETTIPATETTTPAAATTIPAVETTIPAAETTTPAAATTIPAAETTIPAAETTIPAAETTTLAAEISTPAAENTTPAAETTIPAVETTIPAAETTIPAAETTTPAAETTTPAAETTIPATETTTPAAATTTPATETTTPAAATTTPATETTTPAAATTTANPTPDLKYLYDALKRIITEPLTKIVSLVKYPFKIPESQPRNAFDKFLYGQIENLKNKLKHSTKKELDNIKESWIIFKFYLIDLIAPQSKNSISIGAAAAANYARTTLLRPQVIKKYHKVFADFVKSVQRMPGFGIDKVMDTWDKIQIVLDSYPSDRSDAHHITINEAQKGKSSLIAKFKKILYELQRSPSSFTFEQFKENWMVFKLYLDSLKHKSAYIQIKHQFLFSNVAEQRYIRKLFSNFIQDAQRSPDFRIEKLMKYWRFVNKFLKSYKEEVNDVYHVSASDDDYEENLGQISPSPSFDTISASEDQEFQKSLMKEIEKLRRARNAKSP